MAPEHVDSPPSDPRILIDPARLVMEVDRRTVGLRREAEMLAVILATGRHVVLEGPPGTGKSTLLRVVADTVGLGVELVEGNAELTPARLVGSHDPAALMRSGYSPEAFVPGPLLVAMQTGALLYVEELNRLPEETLNVLITVLAEGDIHVPRVGRISARSTFRLIAAMNPFDTIGTARVSQAISDRLCRVAIGYQDEEGERRIVRQANGIDSPTVPISVALTRRTRNDSRIRVGSSVRGAIDMVSLADGLAELRGEESMARDILLDSALASLSGRITLDDDTSTTPEEVITVLLDELLAESSTPDATPGKAPAPPGAPPKPNRAAS